MLPYILVNKPHLQFWEKAIIGIYAIPFLLVAIVVLALLYDFSFRLRGYAVGTPDYVERTISTRARERNDYQECYKAHLPILGYIAYFFAAGPLENELIDSCLISYAAKFDDVDLCDKVEFRFNCIDAVALTNNKYVYCSHIENSWHRGNCLIDFINKDLVGEEICQEIASYSDADQRTIDICYAMLAGKTLDPEICKHPAIRNSDGCYASLGPKLLDRDLCELIADNDMRKRCREQYMSLFCHTQASQAMIDSCLLETAETLKATWPCSSIRDDEMEKICREQAQENSGD